MTDKLKALREVVSWLEREGVVADAPQPIYRNLPNLVSALLDVSERAERVSALVLSGKGNNETVAGMTFSDWRAATDEASEHLATALDNLYNQIPEPKPDIDPKYSIDRFKNNTNGMRTQ